MKELDRIRIEDFVITRWFDDEDNLQHLSITDIDNMKLVDAERLDSIPMICFANEDEVDKSVTIRDHGLIWQQSLTQEMLEVFEDMEIVPGFVYEGMDVLWSYLKLYSADEKK